MVASLAHRGSMPLIPERTARSVRTVRTTPAANDTRSRTAISVTKTSGGGNFNSETALAQEDLDRYAKTEDVPQRKSADALIGLSSSNEAGGTPVEAVQPLHGQIQKWFRDAYKETKEHVIALEEEKELVLKQACEREDLIREQLEAARKREKESKRKMKKLKKKLKKMTDTMKGFDEEALAKLQAQYEQEQEDGESEALSLGLGEGLRLAKSPRARAQLGLGIAVHPLGIASSRTGAGNPGDSFEDALPIVPDLLNERFMQEELQRARARAVETQREMKALESNMEMDKFLAVREVTNWAMEQQAALKEAHKKVEKEKNEIKSDATRRENVLLAKLKREKTKVLNAKRQNQMLKLGPRNTLYATMNLGDQLQIMGFTGMSGWVLKRGQFNTSFKRRYAKLRAGVVDGEDQLAMTYYKTKKSRTPQGEITITPNTLISSGVCDTPSHFEFYIHTKERRFVFGVSSEILRDEWVDSCRAVYRSPEQVPTSEISANDSKSNVKNIGQWWVGYEPIKFVTEILNLRPHASGFCSTQMLMPYTYHHYWRMADKSVKTFRTSYWFFPENAIAAFAKDKETHLKSIAKGNEGMKTFSIRSGHDHGSLKPHEDADHFAADSKRRRESLIVANVANQDKHLNQTGRLSVEASQKIINLNDSPSEKEMSMRSSTHTGRSSSF